MGNAHGLPEPKNLIDLGGVERVRTYHVATSCPTPEAAIFRGELFFPLAALQHAGLPAACGLVPIRSN